MRTKSPCTIPSTERTGVTSSTLPYALRYAARTSPFNCTGTLDPVTLIRQVPLYSGWSRKCLLEALLSANFTASSSEGSRTSQVAKLHWQKYRHGMPADFRSSSKVSFLISANLPVLKSVIMSDRVFGSTSVTSSGTYLVSFEVRSILTDSVPFVVSF